MYGLQSVRSSVICVCVWFESNLIRWVNLVIRCIRFLHKVSRSIVAMPVQIEWAIVQKSLKSTLFAVYLTRQSTVYPIWLSTSIHRIAEVKIIDVCKTRSPDDFRSAIYHGFGCCIIIMHQSLSFWINHHQSRWALCFSFFFSFSLFCMLDCLLSWARQSQHRFRFVRECSFFSAAVSLCDSRFAHK